jgi:hypothetical protein
MVREIVYFIIFFMILSCTVKKNEFKKPRFNESRFSLKMIQGEENKVKRMICLDCIYKLDKVINIHFNEEFVDFKKMYLKFYENGKVAVFNEETIAEMNPKKADMGIYQYKNNKLYYEYFSYSPQAGYYKFTHELWVEDNKLFDKFGSTIRVFTKLSVKSYSNGTVPDW